MEEQYSTRISSSSSSSNSTDSVVVVDWISALPDCILGEILSFLPTKQAVATSLLSKRWKSAWLDIHSLDFHFVPSSVATAPSDSSTEDMAFIRFVHRVLLLLGAKTLNKFSLDLELPAGIISSHIICWIDAAIMRKVREIALYLGYGDLYKLPICCFNCESLQSLVMNNVVLAYNTTVACLPRLETLKLYTVRFTSVEAFEKLINGCPVLHHLEISFYKEENDDDYGAPEEDFTYIVSSPSLRYLDLCIEDMSTDDGCTLKLNAPSLEYLGLRGCISDIIVEKSLSSIVELNLDFHFDENDLPHNLIVEATRAFEHAKFLTASGRVLRVLGGLATKFKRLVKLKVKHCCGFQDFLHNSENLEEVEIDKIYDDDDDDDSRWSAPVVVPSCVSKSLKKVRFDGYKFLEDECEMICYMLEHGAALEVMEIRYKRKLDGEKWLKAICEFPRKSLACKVSMWPVHWMFDELY